MNDMLRGLPARFRRVTSHDRYVPQIDGLRFLAILPVLFWHAGLRGVRFVDPNPALKDHYYSYFMPNGRIGVELFFFISGYIIAFPFFARRAPTLKTFFKRRLLRIEPPYILVITLCFLLLSFSGFHPQHAPNFQNSRALPWQSFLASLAYSHVVIFGREPALNPPAWSLEVEVQFYILSPFILHVLTRIRPPRIRRAIEGGALAATMLLASYLLQSRTSVNQFTILGHAWAFLLGILVCDFAASRSPFTAPCRRWFDITLILGLLCMAFLGRLEDRSWPFLTLVGINFLKATAILAIYGGATRGVIGRRVLGSAWLALIGGACYSIYLTHVPVMQLGAEILFRVVHPASSSTGWLLAITTLVPLAVAAGLLFYVAIERPCMEPDWPARFARRLLPRRRDARSAAGNAVR